MTTSEKQLVTKRGLIKSQLTRFINYFTATTPDELDVLQLQLRLSKIEPLIEEFAAIQLEIALLTDSDVQSETEAFEASYFDIVSKVKGYINEHTLPDKLDSVSFHSDGSHHSASIHSNRSRQSCQTNQSIHDKIKLPRISLPVFDGAYDKWTVFHDTFSSIIHSNNTITDIEKFHYLRSSLTGEAAEVIQSLETSAANYQVAWSLLRERFENTRRLVNKHLGGIFDLKPVTKESYLDLRTMHDNLCKHLRALKVLGQPTDSWDSLLIYIVASKSDPITRRDWERQRIKGELPDFSEFSSFLKNKCELLEALDTGKAQTKHSQSNSIRSIRTHAITDNNCCVFCQRNEHSVYKCKKFLDLSPKDRFNETRAKRLCTNCLRADHYAKTCTSTGTCRQCNKRHHTLLHLSKISTPTNNETADIKPESHSAQTSQSMSVTATHSLQTNNNHILLSTAIVQIADNFGRLHSCRALLDSGSQSSFITEYMCNKLKLQTEEISLSVVGVSKSISRINSKTLVTIKSSLNAFKSELSCLILPKITNRLPSFSFDKDQLKIPHNVTLADANFNRSGNIDLLLGADIFWNLLCVGQVKLGKNLPILHKTHLGWIIAGPLPVNTSSNHTHCNLSTLESIDKALQRFWELEEISTSKFLTKEEQSCEDYFLETTQKTNNGRFMVKMPLLKEHPTKLGDSRESALKRFYSLEKRLQGNKDLSKQYIDFFKEYEELQHMTSIDNEMVTNNDLRAFYLPHHAVIKQSSITTKLRVVFDASAKSSSGYSLNDLQLTGPTIQEDLISIILRFRKYKFVMCADIAKMYRQILISPEQRQYQRILWRSNPNEPVKCYQLNTVTYGTTSAPFLAVRCLHQLAFEYQEIYPKASSTILKDFYVDDLLTGANSIDDAKSIREDLCKILENGGFQLRKWTSNESSILNECIADSSNKLEHVIIGENENMKTLGILWQASTDMLQYSTNQYEFKEKVTKRVVLSTIAHIFDPLGLLAPAIVTAKIILQQLWQLKISWDESLPVALHTQWKQFQTEFQSLNKIQIPRRVICSDAIRIELHGFSDASEKAYGGCVYIRSLDSSGLYHTQLLCAKSRVAPLKNLTIPRLELCGALLLAQLMDKAISALDMTFDSLFYWCDSTIVLAWISKPSQNWKTFVSNRVSQIQNLTTIGNWNHIKTEDNPADLVSRGINPLALKNCSLWWHGPSWLSQHSHEWLQQQPSLPIDLPERRANTVALTSSVSDCDIFEKYSSLSKLQRVIAYCLRFKNNALQSGHHKQTGTLTVEELQYSLRVLIKKAQFESFSKEMHALSIGRIINSQSKILNLNPFIDSNGIMRVGGRLGNSDYDFDKKHPVLLPAKHRLTQLIIEYEHRRLLHAGPLHLLSALREKYWPLSGRDLVKRIVHNCVRCFKAKPTNKTPIMAHLPKARTLQSRPFKNCGVDYAGYFLIRDRRGRGFKTTKAYVCLFVCFVSKAIHLELVTDLTTESFLAALRRFVSRRGKCSNIYSDNGTNFVKANSELKDLQEFLVKNQNEIKNALSQDQTTWHFIPAQSPHFGGLWEAGVKSVKYHLRRVTVNACLTYEQFLTVLIQIEACLNSRPLCPLTDDPHDNTPLTPAHFLIGETLTGLPDENVMEVPDNRLSCYQHLQSLKQHFWARWSKEYISELQVRVKWKQQIPNLLKPGVLVIIKEDNLPPLRWQLGRVVEVHRGSDDVIRAASIKTNSGVYKRAAHKLCVLPSELNSMCNS